MRKIGFTTSAYSTKITPENIGSTIEQMDPDFPTSCSWVSNDWNAGFDMISSQMDTMHMLHQKMMQILFWMSLSLGLPR